LTGTSRKRKASSVFADLKLFLLALRHRQSAEIGHIPA
jgi:hypothetical protein